MYKSVKEMIIENWIIMALKLCTNCVDQLCLHIFLRCSNLIFVYSFAFTIYGITMNSPAPSWLDSSVSRAQHCYRRSHGFESHSGLNAFLGNDFKAA